MLVTDLNGDGMLDVVVGGQGKVAIHLQSARSVPGDAAFLTESDLPLTDQATGVKLNVSGIASGDFNGDRILDLVVCSSNSASVALFFGLGSAGQGNGTFAPPERFSIPGNTSFPSAVVAAELTGDRILDLIFLIPADAGIVVFRGLGVGGAPTGQFTRILGMHAGNLPVAMVAGDFDSNGLTDLAIAAKGDGSVSVLLGTPPNGVGGAGFAAAVKYPAGSAPSALAIGDLTRDGIQDLIVSSGPNSTVYYLVGNGSAFEQGNGTFAPAREERVAGQPGGVAVADFDHDGILDIAATLVDQSSVEIIRGGGSQGDWVGNTFGTYALGAAPLAVAAAQLNGDALPDLLIANPLAARMSILLNGCPYISIYIPEPPPVPPPLPTPTPYTGCPSGQALGLASVSLAVAGRSPHGLASADFNSDGIPDLAIANSAFNGPADGANLTIVLRGADGSLGVRQSYSLGAGAKPFSVVATDFNGDGRADLAVSDYALSRVAILLNRATGGSPSIDFQPPTYYPCGVDGFALRAADLNGDLILDLAVLGNGTPNVSILLGQGVAGIGNGAFGAATLYPLPANRAASLAVADFDGDGARDLAVTLNEMRMVAVLRGLKTAGLPDARFGPAVTYCTGTTCSDTRPWDVVAADVTYDGRPDLIVADVGTSQISIMINLPEAPGHVTLMAAPPIDIPGGAAHLAVADIDSDGVLDIAVAGRSFDSEITFVKGYLPVDGQPKFFAVQHVPLHELAFGLAIVPVPATGLMDLITANFSTDSLTMCRTGCTVDPFAAPPPPPLLYVGDWDVDGKRVCLTRSLQRSPVGVGDGSGGAYIVWQDYRNGLQTDLYLMHLGSNGDPVPGWPSSGRRICIATGDQLDAQAVSDGAGGCIVTWADVRSDPELIYTVRVLANVSIAPGWTENGAPFHLGNLQSGFSVAADGAGGAFYAVLEVRAETPQIIVYHLAGSAEPAPGWPADGVALTGGPGFGYFSPQLVADGAGGAIVSWSFSRALGASDTLDAQGVSFAGVSAGAIDWQSHVFSLAPGSTLAPDGARGVLVSESFFPGTIIARRLDDSGESIWNTDICAQPTVQGLPAMVADGLGGGYFVWVDLRNGGQDIYASRILGNGQIAPGWNAAGLSLCSAYAAQTAPHAVAVLGHSLLACWEDRRMGNSDLFCALRDASGRVPGGWAEDGNRLCVAGADQVQPFVFSDGANGAFITWQDARFDGDRVYAQHLSVDLATPTTLAMVSSEADPDRVRIEWYAAQGAGLSVTVYRREPGSAWTALRTLRADGTGHLTLEDREVIAGKTYEYRLGWIEEGVETFGGAVTVEVPLRAEFSLAGARPNPAVRFLHVSFSLPDLSPARVEVLDVTGRRVASREVHAAQAGAQAVEFGEATTLRAGVYLVRLTQGGRSLTRRVVLIR
jgi:hypothetical protein